MPVKVLHTILCLMSGGAERQLVDVVCNTSDEFSHTVCTIWKADFFAEDVRKSGANLIEFDLKGKRPWVSGASRLRKIIKEVKPDIIHSWMLDGHVIARMAMMAGKKIPNIASLQNTDYEPETVQAAGWSPKKVQGLLMIDKLSAKLTKPFFVACSKEVERSYIKTMGVDPERIKVIYNSVDPNTLAAAPGEAAALRESFGIPANAFVYLNIGRLDPQKGQSYLVEAFARALPDVSNGYLVIVGAGNLEGPLKELADSLKVADRVIFAGRRRDIGACLEMSDVFVFPSLFEGLGIVLVEAMVKGLAPIASSLDVLREVAGNDAALYVPPASAEELAAAMVRIYKEPELRRSTGENARKRAEEKFLSSVLMPEWKKVYAEAAARQK